MDAAEDTFDQQSCWDDLFYYSGIIGNVNAASSDHPWTNDGGYLEIHDSPFNILSEDNTCQRKRTGESKALREKMRREKLNDRFTELCAILGPGRSSKTDKSAILVDAIHVLNHLRTEAHELAGKNGKLQDEIKHLKEQKSKLREQKLLLKSSKDKLAQQVKSMAVIPTGVMAPHIPIYQATANKTMAPSYSGYPMWHWIPSAILDTSQDHVLRPPVA